MLICSISIFLNACKEHDFYRTLVKTGSLGINIDAANGFDIGSTSGTAYAIFTVGAAQGLYAINLTTGAATKTSDFSKSVRGFTVGLGF